MSTILKVIVFLVVVGAVVAGVWYSKNSLPAPQSVSEVNSNEPATPASTTVDPAQAVSARDASSASLDQDMSAVDVELQAVEDGSSSVDQSLSDKPVAQTE